MKKMAVLLLAAVCVMALAGCGSQGKDVAPQLDALILDTDPENRIITVEDVPEQRVFGRSTRVDCGEAPVYHEGDTVSEISFLDLEPGDRIRITFNEKAQKALSKGKREVSALQVEILN